MRADAFRVPASLTYETLHDELKRRGFVIYAGQGRFDASVFQISVMGEIEDEDLDRLLRAFRAVLG